MNKAIVLLSGGLDSATALYEALRQGYDCSALIFDYGQRHRREIAAAGAVARRAGVPAQVVEIRLPWKGSALLDTSIKIPGCKAQDTRHKTPSYALRASEGRQDTGYTAPAKIPSTYVPGRNIIFLSFALSFAEASGSSAIFIGAHCQDYSGYPDCRPEFFRAFARAAAAGTRAGVEKKAIAIKTPLIRKNKAQIIRMGARLGVPFELTWSCYRGGARPCGTCDSCRYRAKGFREAGIKEARHKTQGTRHKAHQTSFQL